MKINIAKGPPTKLQKASIKADKERQEEAIHSSRVTADHLDNLAQEMRNVGARLEKHGELYSSEALAKSKELIGAADMAREWARKLRVSVEKNAGGDGSP